MNKEKEYLFSYGTLQLEAVQIAIYGRKLYGTADVLDGYEIEQLEVLDKSVLQKSKKQFHPIAVASKNKSSSIQGVIFEITRQELWETDKYEVMDYKRVLKVFRSGKEAWVYVKNKD